MTQDCGEVKDWVIGAQVRDLVRCQVEGQVWDQGREKR